MFRHRRALINISVVLVLFTTTHGQSNSRSYDTNDWIPVSRPCPTCPQNDEPQIDSNHRRPTGRVLNLPSSDQKPFFPTSQDDSQSYNLREEKPAPQKPRLIQNPDQFQQQQQIVLPSQLHSLITNSQPYLSPQRINNQLLHASNGLNYQQTGQAFPRQQFPLNGTEFNSRDVVQNINLGLYNQQQLTQQQGNVQQNGNNGREEVQLLYVPLENLRGQRQQTDLIHKVDQKQQTPLTYQEEYQPVQHKQEQLQNIQQDFVQQALQAQKLQEQFQHNVSPIPQHNFRRPYTNEPVTLPPTTTPAPKKRKPHQPPLAVYMGTEGHDEIKLGDVLTLLKDAKTISVQDNVGPDAPQVFVGPSHLAPPNGYVKFDLPYLSSIENNRVERKVDQLPFFVAPLSYKAPAGYSKIPFPAPHVGSVVINNLKATSEEHTTTEGVYYQLNQNEDERNSHVPYSSEEVSTVRPRGRQRPSPPNSYATSTIQTLVSSEIPYGPLTTKNPLHEQQYSTNSPNPYGPTQFVQTTTPAIFEHSASIPEQIFLTKNRFTAPAQAYNLHNIPDRHAQFVQQHQDEASVTEYTPLATTLSSVVSNDKYTVLEQFPLPEKKSQNKYSEDSVTQRVPNRQYSRGRPDNFYNDESKEESSVSNIQSSQYLVETVKSPYGTSKEITQQYIPQQQEVLNTQIPFEYYSQPSNRPVQHETSAEIHSSRPQKEHNNQQYTTEQSKAINEETTRQSRPNLRVRGKQHFTPNPNYKDDYETQNIRNKPVTHNSVNNQQIHQHQTPVYDSQESSVFTQNTRDRDSYYKQDYESQNINTKPVHPLHQQVTQHNAGYDSQEILHKVQPQVSRGRDHNTQEIPIQLINQQAFSGRNTPQLLRKPFREEQAYNQKPIEQVLPVTRESIVNYEIPIVSTQKPHEVVEQSQYINVPYYTPEQDPTRLKNQPPYTLPSQLPPISPHLPGLVNSLEDQALRPLLAPLLIPASEQTPVTEYTSEFYTTPSSSTTTTTTSVPIVETTTQFKRTRGRQRGTRPSASYDYVNTTPTSRRTSSYRGRRPYTSRTRQEYPKQVQEESVPVPTVIPEIVTETTTKATLNRNRFVQRERQYVSSTTEQPRRSEPNNSRQRFKTRGRPIKSDEEYTERSTTEHLSSFKQPPLEGGFQVSSPVIHDIDLSQPIISNPRLNSQDQALVFVQNANKQILQEHAPIQISTEEYIPHQHYGSSTELVEPLQQSTILVSAPENNIVSDDHHNDGVVLVNHKQNQQVTYPIIENTNVNQHEYNSNLETNINRFKYEDTEINVQTTTTESPRIRSRVRSRPRTRGHQSASTRSQTPSSTTTETQKTTTESKDEESGEFYGFFRPPSFVKPVKMEYKQSSELRTANPIPTVAYIRRPTEDDPNIYISPANSPVYSTPSGHIDDNQAEHNIRTQYVSSTIVPHTESSEEDFVDVKPVTHRPNSSFNRRRPIASSRVETSTTLPQRVTEKYYTVRPSKRPEIQPPKITRIRGRIRKPTRPTTVAPIVETESPNTYSSNHQQHYSRTNELSNTHSEEYSIPAKTRQRITNRGRSHFQLPQNEKLAASLEPESDNYPSSFLRNQQPHHQKLDTIVTIPESADQKPVNVLSIEEVVTPRSTFQLTIEPEDNEEYADQIPYSSVIKHRGVNLEDGGAESKYSAKIVQRPNNFNFIVSNEKSITNLDKTTEILITVDNTDFTTVKNEPVVTETDTPLQAVKEVTTFTPEVDTQTESITDVPTTTIDELSDKPRRRGVWKLVKLRPVTDEFESAESQNVGTVFDNSFINHEKPVRTYHAVQRIRTTTEELEQEATTVNVPEVIEIQKTVKSENDKIHRTQSTTEGDIFAPLYEMFGYSRDGGVLNQYDASESDGEISDVTTLITPTVIQDDIETTTTGFNNTTEVGQDYSSQKEDKIKIYSDRLEVLEDKNIDLTAKDIDLLDKEIDLADTGADEFTDLSVKGSDLSDKDTNLSDKNENPTTEDSWKNRIIGTSTTTEISHETEICYRGRCVKSSTEEKSDWV